MECKIEDGVLVVTTESVSETEELTEWRAKWRADPDKDKKADTWFTCLYFNPIQTVVI